MTITTSHENLLHNALTAALREIERCPDDSMQDIVNEQLKLWQTGLRVDIGFCFETDDTQSE